MRNIFSIRRLFLLLPLLLLSVLAQASHFRYGNLTWRTVTTDATKRTVQLKVTESFRKSFFAGNITVGSVVSGVDVLRFGDGTTTNINLTVTSVDAAADNFYGEFTINHTYVSNGDYTAYFSSSNRLTTLFNNANGVWYVRTVVNAGTGNNSPVSTLPPVVNLATGQTAATFQLPANDPDSDPLTYSLATSTDLGGNTFVNAPGLTINPTTGVITFPTTGAPVDRLYNAIVKVSDGKTSIMVDFIIQITKVSTPPKFDYSLTPTNGYVYQVAPGTPVNFSVRATDGDVGDVVTLKAVGLPTGSSMSSALPLTGNPVASAFSWTPTASNLGTYVLTFVAQDNVGVQTNTSVTIQVSTKPTFDVPPTPSNGSIVQITPGTLITRTIQASNADPATLVRITSASGLPSATFSPALPTPAANPTSTQLNWTPVLADWGLNAVTFTAQNTNSSDQSTHTLQFVVNSAPSFTSTPTPASLNVVAGQPFSYSITMTDPDLPYGDELEIEEQNLPAWLTLTDNHDGTGTLSGTPAVADAGNNDVTLVAADIFHHGASYGLIKQQFTINVIPCTLQAHAQPLTLVLDANGTATLTTAQFDNGSTATCGITSLTLSQSAFSCANYGANAVTLTVTDTYGNTSTDTQTVLVTDNTAPTAMAQNVTVALDASGNATITADQVNNGSTDACGIASVSVSPSAFTCANVGPNAVTLTVTDTHGNVSTTTAVVTVTDAIAPVALAKNITVPLSASGAASITASQINNGSTDNCGIASISVAPSTFTCANFGPNTVTLMVTDTHGNVSTATATVTITDVTAPTAATQNLTVNLSASGTASITAAQVNNGSSDACGIASVSVAPMIFTCANAGANTVTLTVTDIRGNVATATAIVTVRDNIAPTLSACPANIVVTAAANDCTPAVTWMAPVGADNCGFTLTSTAASGSRFPVGTTPVTYTATDASGNKTTCSFTVTVKASPVVVTLSSPTFGGGVNVACAGGTSGSATATVLGGCQPYRYLWSNGQTTATAKNLAAGTYSVTVTDANNTSATQRITLTQSTPVVVSTSYSPQFTCVGGQTSTIYLGYGLQYLTLSANATGGTNGYTYSWSPAAGLNRTTGTSVVASPRVTTVYTVTATDANGCSSSKQFTVYVYNVLCGNLDLKIAMCHNGREICVGIAAVPAQLLLGATLGSCTYGNNNSRGTITLAESAPAATSATITLTEKLTVEAFPNPSGGIFRVRLQTPAAGHTKVQLYDLQGRVVGTVFEGELHANEQRELAVDLPGLAAGTYLLRVQSGALIENLRVTVQH